MVMVLLPTRYRRVASISASTLSIGDADTATGFVSVSLHIALKVSYGKREMSLGGQSFVRVCL